MILNVLYIIGIVVEAMTGALAAGRCKMDLFGVIITASVTAIGGGSIRDIILGNYPLGWVKNPEYIVIVSIAAVATTLISPFINHLRKLFLILDSLGLVVFSIIGAQIALDSGQSPTIVAIAAVITGVFGGILRDMFCNSIPLVFQKELYASISFICGWIYILLMHIQLNHELVVFVTLILGFVARLLSIRFHLCLPIFNYTHTEI